jgi:hypothetical protein
MAPVEGQFEPAPVLFALAVPGAPDGEPDVRLAVSSDAACADEGLEMPGQPVAATTRFDTERDLFHRATIAGLACASCHPAGEDDGHVWTFEELGPRRTQDLAAGLSSSEPFLCTTGARSTCGRRSST